jgi:mannose-6-phosphate isomerase-like protein (cupin superfamily)
MFFGAQQNQVRKMITMRVRRVVTGHDVSGNAIIISDGVPPVIRAVQHRPGFCVNEMWATMRMPAPTREEDDPTLRLKGIEPPANGTAFRIVELPPEADFIHTIDREKVRAAYADRGSPRAIAENENPPHPFMHKTKSVDYGIVLSGEVHLVLDDSETLLKEGDVVIQRGTNHAWANRSDKPCRIAFILIDGTLDH